jgi:sialate O-acetylesterase
MAAFYPGDRARLLGGGILFARELRQRLHCPIGVISAAWGGTPIQSWISLNGLETEPRLARPLEKWRQALDQYRRLQQNPEPSRVYTAELQRWRKSVEPVFNAANKKYNEAKATGLAVGERPRPAWPEPQNPDPMGMPSPSRRPQTPTVSFNGMIAPLAPFALRGVIWYQGEADGEAGLEYRALFPRLIQDWRAHWGEALPFLFVQLPGFGPDPTPVAERGWPWTREAQFRALNEPCTGMAITIDIGDPADVHPADKRDVGHRLALLARRKVYGETISASGPLFQECSFGAGIASVRFSETGGGLVIGQAPWRASGVAPLPTERLIGFYVAGADHNWVEADARIVAADRVVVSSPAVPSPVAVRYGWANSPRCNLYNREALPTAPFRTDDWPARASGSAPN